LFCKNDGGRGMDVKDITGVRAWAGENSRPCAADYNPDQYGGM